MVTLTYFEAVLLIVIMGLFLFFSFRSRKIVFYEDRNFYHKLRKEIVESISEDERQQIYLDEYKSLKKMIVEQMKESGEISDDANKPKDMSKTVPFPDPSKSVDSALGLIAESVLSDSNNNDADVSVEENATVSIDAVKDDEAGLYSSEINHSSYVPEEPGDDVVHDYVPAQIKEVVDNG